MRAASIPVYCTGPALILTGSLMMINVVRIEWNDINKAVPAFLTISLMPLTYSISYGAGRPPLHARPSLPCGCVKLRCRNPLACLARGCAQSAPAVAHARRT